MWNDTHKVLPEPYTMVLAYIPGINGIVNGEMLLAYRFTDFSGGSDTMPCWAARNSRIHGIRYWMALPEPPKEEE